jgi:hypothetical protein
VETRTVEEKAGPVYWKIDAWCKGKYKLFACGAGAAHRRINAETNS